MSYTVVRDLQNDDIDRENAVNVTKRHCKIGRIAVRPPKGWLIDTSKKPPIDKHFRRVPHPHGPYTNYLIELGKRHAPIGFDQFQAYTGFNTYGG